MPKAAMLALVRKQKRVIPNEVRDLHFATKELCRAAGNLAKAAFSSGRGFSRAAPASTFRGLIHWRSMGHDLKESRCLGGRSFSSDIKSGHSTGGFSPCGTDFGISSQPASERIAVSALVTWYWVWPVRLFVIPTGGSTVCVEPQRRDSLVSR